MKFLNKLLLIAFAIAALAIPNARAQTGFSLKSTAIGTTNSYCVVPVGRAAATVQYINASSDATNAAVKFWTAADPVYCSVVSAISQATISVAAYSAITNGNVIVVRSVANDTYQRIVVSSVTATTIVGVENLNFALAVGDPIYLETSAGTIPIGSGTHEINNTGGIFHGQNGKPVLLDVASTSVVSIILASGVWDRYDK